MNQIGLNVKSIVGLGTEQKIEADPKETIKELKDKIAAMQAVDANSIALQWQGKVLEDQHRLKDYGISDGATVEVVPKTRIGGL